MGSIDLPKTTKTWSIEGTSGFDDLKFKEVPIPELSGNDVLVKFHFASLNYRDLIMPKGKLSDPTVLIGFLFFCFFATHFPFRSFLLFPPLF